MTLTNHIPTGISDLKGNPILAMIQNTPEGAMVAIKPLCSALKISWQPQHEKLSRDPRSSHHDIVMTGSDGKKYQMICLPAEQVPMWINSINSNKVGEEKRQALLELHKFFGYALNEFSRGRFVTQEQHAKDMAEIRGQLTTALRTIEILMEENETLRRANGYRASAASYQMHARKAELKH